VSSEVRPAYMPSWIPGMPAGVGAWGGYAAGREGSITRAPALPVRWPGMFLTDPLAVPRSRS
jgi:hypothetical protein